MDKHNRKLDIISQLDDDIIEKQTKRRIALLSARRKKRSHKRRIIAIGSVAASLALIASTVLLLVTLLGKAVPIYTGMSLSSTPPATQALVAYDAPAQSPATTTLSSLKETPVTPSAAPLSSPYFSQPGKDVYITVHIDNPDSFEILSFTLNGKKYTSYMFEPGSDLENLIVKINVGDTEGAVDYTIDAVKYVDGEDIKDVKMEGERTVRIIVSKKIQSEGTHANDLKYTVSQDDQAIEITGLKNKSVTELVLPESISGIPVTAIAADAFKDEYQLTKVVVPDSVTAIGAGAFNGCGSLREITLPFVGGELKQETDLHQYPFGYIFGTASYAGGKAVEQVYFGASTSTTTSTIYYIPLSLSTVTLTGGNILRGAFYRCSMLTTVHLPERLATIGAFGFGSCSSLAEIELPDSLIALEHHAFSECAMLTQIELPDALRRIDTRAFLGCPLKSLTLPSGLQSIAEGAFLRCSKLERITVEEGNPYFYVESGCLIDVTSKTLLSAAVGSTIPTTEDITAVGDGAFAGAAWLTQLTVPANIQKISRYAFYGCENLQAVQFSTAGTLREIGERAFERCKLLSGISIPNGVRTLGANLFANCQNLTSLTLPASLVSVNANMLGEGNALTNVYFLGVSARWKALGVILPAWVAVHCIGG